MTEILACTEYPVEQVPYCKKKHPAMARQMNPSLLLFGGCNFLKADAFEQCKGVADDAAEGILIGFARNSRRLGLAAGVTALQDASAESTPKTETQDMYGPQADLQGKDAPARTLSAAPTEWVALVEGMEGLRGRRKKDAKIRRQPVKRC